MLKVNIAVAGRDADYTDAAAADAPNEVDADQDVAAGAAVVAEEPTAFFKHGKGTWMSVDEMRQELLPNGAQYRG